MHVNIHLYIHAYMPYIHKYIQKYIHVCTYAYVHKYKNTYTHAYMHAYTHIYMHTYIHTRFVLARVFVTAICTYISCSRLFWMYPHLPSKILGLFIHTDAYAYIYTTFAAIQTYFNSCAGKLAEEILAPFFPPSGPPKTFSVAFDKRANTGAER